MDSPVELPLVLLALLGVAWFARREGRRAGRAFAYPDLRLLSGLPRGRAGEVERARPFLRGLILALLVVAAARPGWPDYATPVSVEGIAIALVIDASGSMADPLPGPGRQTRLSAAKAAARRLLSGDGAGLPGRPQDRAALVGFAALPRTLCPLTFDHAALLAQLDQLTPAEGIDAATGLGDALAEALARLEAAPSSGGGRKVIVLVTDGEHNAPPSGEEGAGALSPRQAARLAEALSVPVYAIDCGPEPGGAGGDAEARGAAAETLAEVARRSGGRSFRAADATGFAEATAQIDRLERARAPAFRYRRRLDLAPHFAGLAALLLVAERLLAASRWRVRP